MVKENTMTYRGHVKDGAVVLDEPVSLPEGADIRVDVLPRKRRRSTLGQRLLRHAGTAKGLPPDASRNLDHYLYGAPKK